jgi:hypothetical protein
MTLQPSEIQVYCWIALWSSSNYLFVMQKFSFHLHLTAQLNGVRLCLVFERSWIEIWDWGFCGFSQALQRLVWDLCGKAQRQEGVCGEWR